jgi:hypothetical protein
MALSDKDIVIAVSVSLAVEPDKAFIKVANMDSDKFPTRTIPLKTKEEGYFDIDSTKHEWSNYFLSGVKVGFCLFASLIMTRELWLNWALNNRFLWFAWLMALSQQ